MIWDLIVDGALDGESNMAIDASLLDEVEKAGARKTVLRFYRWSGPTVSLGRNQKIDKAVDAGYCRAHNIDVVHRPTGGRAVLHDDELTYAIVSNDSSAFGETIYGNYKRVSEALCLGFNRLGIPSLLAPDTLKPQPMMSDMDAPCFLSPSRYELTVNGRKIAGSAQRRLRRSFLQHGSLPITVDTHMLAHATRMANPEILPEEMAGSAEFLKFRPTFQELIQAFVKAFQDCFSASLTLTPPDCYKRFHDVQQRGSTTR